MLNRENYNYIIMCRQKIIVRKLYRAEDYFMFCGACGKENEDGALFCAYCGNKFIKKQYDKKYDEAVEHLKYEGFEILSESGDDKSQDIVVEDRVNKEPVKKEKISKVSNNEEKIHNNKVNDKLEFDNKDNSRKYANNMGQVVVDEKKKKKKDVPLIAAIVILIILIFVGICGFAYYFLSK